MADLLGGMPTATFEQDLQQVLTVLHRVGARILVSNLLPIYLFPAYRTCEARPSSCGLFGSSLPPAEQLESAVTSYDQAIREAASFARASLANVTTVFARRLASAGRSGSPALVDQSDLGLTEAGEQLVAEAFKSAY
jgi:hypothetical protein